MSDKRYPTRMHEVLGVEPEERFTYSEWEFWLSESGLLYRICDDGTSIPATQGRLVFFINNPERITRRPRLTEEQVEQLKAAQLLVNAKWLAKDKDGGVVLFGRKPNRDGDMSAWIDDDCNYWWFLPSDTPLSGLVSWSDPAPLDIVQVLRQNGVEVEG